MKMAMGKLSVAIGMILVIGSTFAVYPVNAEQDSNESGKAINPGDSSLKILTRYRRQNPYPYGYYEPTRTDDTRYSRGAFSQLGKVLLQAGKQIAKGVGFGVGEYAGNTAAEQAADYYRQQQQYSQQQQQQYQPSYYGK